MYQTQTPFFPETLCIFPYHYQLMRRNFLTMCAYMPHGKKKKRKKTIAMKNFESTCKLFAVKSGMRKPNTFSEILGLLQEKK